MIDTQRKFVDLDEIAAHLDAGWYVVPTTFCGELRGMWMERVRA